MNVPSFWAVGTMIFTAFIAYPRRSASQEPPPGWYAPVGLTAGTTFGGMDLGFFLGGEASGVHLGARGWWIGGYFDGVYHFGSKKTRISVGPEGGWGPFGLDGGYLVANIDDKSEHGFQLRAVLSLTGYFTPFIRTGFIFVDGKTANFGEIGLLIKAPIPISIKKREQL